MVLVFNASKYRYLRKQHASIKRNQIHGDQLICTNEHVCITKRRTGNGYFGITKQERFRDIWSRDH